ncbi:hypothetical protein [Arenimonas caeni]|jgi:hypothetical protein|uniref:Uncharacterized protein n=1 Tax=Arenimonas caeni TaxID=2058085 RepID=A0A2P6M6B8_9GAMM|nr:hypothetical protein [Arenimonas caeni]MDY0021111.1 hypothetical protein [Arenimonas caeni]PRH81543.1 hypothetical protein C6N40_12060 [Arenimonas caeni]
MTMHSICFAGLSRDEQGQVEAAFAQANAGNRWQLASESEAGVVVVDMDSMYGQMSLMKALSNGKVVVALTAGARADTDYRLDRPVTADGVATLLAQIEAGAPSPTPEPAPEPEPVAAPVVEAAPAPVAAAEQVPEPAPAPAPVADPIPEPEPAPQAEPRLAAFLRPGALAGPVRVQVEGAPALVIDPANKVYFSGPALKPLLPYATADIHEADLQPVDPATLPALASELGGSHPLGRLAWILALGGHNGSLAPGNGLNDRYKLLKWPQTEREFPRHFRIATVMMKGPALLTDIAEQSGASLAEVCDFVNASLAVGVAEPDLMLPSEPEPAKGGLLGRFRR